MPAPEVDARRAEAADRAELARLAELATQELGAGRGGAVWARREGAWLSTVDGESAPHGTLFVGTLDAIVVGAAAVVIEPLGSVDRLAVLKGIFVEPGARELGVGERLMAEVVALAVAQNCEGVDSFVLPGNRDAKNFFEAHGLVARGIVVHRRLDAGAS